MWNENNILDNDMSSKFEGKMFCNFGGGGSSSASSDTGGYDVFGTGAVGDTTNFSSGGGSYSDDSPSYSGGGYVDTSSLAGLLEASAGTTPAAQSAAQQIQEALNAPSYTAPPPASTGDSTVDAILQMAQNVNLTPAPMPVPTTPYTTNFQSITGNTGNRLRNLQNRLGDMSTEYMERLLGAQMGLGQRAGVYSRFKDTDTGSGLPFPSIFGLLGKGLDAFGEWSANAKFEDIQKGYIPQFNKLGQIVATIDPETGQLGRGSVEGAIDYSHPDTIAERKRLEGLGVTILDNVGMGLTSRDENQQPPSALEGTGLPQPVTQDISMIPTGQIAAGGTPMYRQTLLDVAPTQYGGLLAGTTPSDFDVANRAFRMTGATYPEYFTDPYSMQGYSILT